MGLGANIETRRTTLGLSRLEVYDRSRELATAHPQRYKPVNPATLARIERGETRAPRSDVLCSIAAALDASLDALMGASSAGW